MYGTLPMICLALDILQDKANIIRFGFCVAIEPILIKLILNAVK